jgi:hypothetical protein
MHGTHNRDLKAPLSVWWCLQVSKYSQIPTHLLEELYHRVYYLSDSKKTASVKALVDPNNQQAEAKAFRRSWIIITTPTGMANAIEGGFPRCVDSVVGRSK